MNYSIILTESFKKQVKNLFKKYHSLKNDLAMFEKELSINPFIGSDLGNNARKIRLAISSKNKGKRGGARIITYNLVVDIEDTEIYLLSIYDKGKKDAISQQEIEDLKKQNDLA
ncbi:hypothetical protein FACS1894199_11910 [Bacteroidia bacterium]|nr:hypothetical protein FACS1894199_11910 [Bacteroidia bacterium]